MSEKLEDLTPNQRRALSKALSALETMAAIWGAEIRLNEVAQKLASTPEAERAKAVAAFIEQAFIEGAYRHYLDRDPAAQDKKQVPPNRPDESAEPSAGTVCATNRLSFQSRVQPWLLECFGAEIAADRIERNHRFFEEATELVQANGMTRSEAHQLVDYTFDRPVGELHQEVGGVMVTLAALCLASGENMHVAGETELARIWKKVVQIRAKQAAKPKYSPLPEHVATPAASPVPQIDRSKFSDVMGWTDDDWREVFAFAPTLEARCRAVLFPAASAQPDVHTASTHSADVSMQADRARACGDPERDR